MYVIGMKVKKFIIREDDVIFVGERNDILFI